MRIIHWCSTFLAGGAIAETVLGLANAQTALGHEVLVISRAHTNPPAYNKRLSEELRAELHSWKPPLTLMLGKLPASLLSERVRATLRQYAADVLHIHNGILPEDVVARRVLPRTPAVLTPHGAFYPEALSTNVRIYVALLKQLFYRRLNAFHALSPAEAQVLRQLFGNQDIYVAPSGLSSQFLCDTSNSAPRDDMFCDPIRLVCVGRLDIRTKGLDILLQSFASAAAHSAARLELMLVGPYSARDYSSILALIGHLGIENSVLIPGATDRQGVAGYLRRADIFVQISRWDAFSLAAIEAMALGLPCVLSSRVGVASYPQVASLPSIHITEPQVDEVTGAILEIAGSLRSERHAATTCGPQVKEFFSWERAAGEHERVYRRLADT